MISGADWVDAGHGFEGVEPSLKLTGWSKARRVVVRRRLIDGTADLPEEYPIQLQRPSFKASDPVKRYEYSALVTILPHEVLSSAQLYHDRADSENCFDELKNQWRWGGYTTQDLKRCRLVAVVHNWWTLFVRLAQPQKHSEAITGNHAKSHIIQSALQALTWFLAQLKKTAEQLTVASRMRIITRQAFRLFLDRIPPMTPLLLVLG